MPKDQVDIQNPSIRAPESSGQQTAPQDTLVLLSNKSTGGVAGPGPCMRPPQPLPPPPGF